MKKPAQPGNKPKRGRPVASSPLTHSVSFRIDQQTWNYLRSINPDYPGLAAREIVEKAQKKQ